MQTKQTFDVNDVAEVLGTTPAAIRMALHRGLDGETIPPSFKLGNKRVWLRDIVYEWLKNKATGNSNNIPPPRRGRRRIPATGKLRKDINTEESSKPLPKTKPEKGRE